MNRPLLTKALEALVASRDSMAAHVYQAKMLNLGDVVTDAYQNLLRKHDESIAALRAALEQDAAPQEVERIVLGNQRYEKVRKLNAAQFAEIYRQNIEKNIPFDDLIDRIDAQRGE